MMHPLFFCLFDFFFCTDIVSNLQQNLQYYSCFHFWSCPPPPLQEISGFSILFASWLPLLLQAVTQNESVLNEQKQ